MSRRSFREKFHAPKPEPHFRWRGKEVSRIEGLSDAVFAFAVTLLIVALEVPKTFEALLDAMRGFPAFVVCFSLLMLFWNVHYRYFRRYGLEDRTTRFVTLAILLLVLFSVYPLKFLFGAVLPFGSHEAPKIETIDQLRFVYSTYGLGFASIWTLYAALHHHALSKRYQLDLNTGEVLMTQEVLTAMWINVAVCLLSVCISRFSDIPGLPGLIYLILFPLLVINSRYFRRKVELWASETGKKRYD